MQAKYKHTFAFKLNFCIVLTAGTFVFAALIGLPCDSILAGTSSLLLLCTAYTQLMLATEAHALGNATARRLLNWGAPQ
jgi:hypothetical protein